MKIGDFFKIVRKHLKILVFVPIFVASLVVFFTRNPKFRYESEVTLFTGIATGVSVDVDKTFNNFTTNIAFDNLINITRANKTKEEVGIRLLAQHLLLEKSNPKYISAKSFEEIREMTPAYIRSAIPLDDSASKVNHLSYPEKESDANETFIFNITKELAEVPEGIAPEVYEQTVANLTELMGENDSNFVYELIHYPNPYYSIHAISNVKAERVANSDMVQLKYETFDPGICQQTLVILANVCIRNYRSIKESRSDVVVKYFEHQLRLASGKLKRAEDKLLGYYQDNNIINYYEQSKAVAIVKEDLDVAYNEMLIRLVGIESAIARLEEQLQSQGKIQLETGSLIQKKNLLGELKYKIALSQLTRQGDSFGSDQELKEEADKLEKEIQSQIDALYSFNYSTDGVPLKQLLTQWLDYVVEAEDIKGGLKVFEDQIAEFQKQYAIYAPAGANVKRIEREISVTEREFLQILYGLNLAKLKMQDNELASSIKVMDPPFFPLSPIPTKRKFLVALGAIVGSILVLTVVFVLEFFDNSLKNPSNASKVLNLPFAGAIPRITVKSRRSRLSLVVDRLLESIIQYTELGVKDKKESEHPKVILFVSTTDREGKTSVMQNLAFNLKKKGRRVLVLQPSLQSADEESFKNEKYRPRWIRSAVSWLLGYSDSKIDYENPFFSIPEGGFHDSELMSYPVNEQFFSAQNYEQLIERSGGPVSSDRPEYVFIEIPPLLHFSYPSRLVLNADLALLVCRASRTWSEADNNVLRIFKGILDKNVGFILNGMEFEELKSIGID